MEWATAVHPHARGERHGHEQAERCHFGSSPRPWGTLPRELRRAGGGRFIPTPVGNAQHPAEVLQDRTVHPHARGERAAAMAREDLYFGSSPRPWGTPVRPMASRVLVRFIPTPVGNARPLVYTTQGWPVHPHARGERVRVRAARANVPGSSPRPWGTHEPAEELIVVDRFIPTPVGNAPSGWSGQRRSTVHPHARGERLTSGEVAGLKAGSSPRPWGTHHGHLHQLPVRRFIPTPVGNARQRRRGARRTSVHPHARGERSAGA